MGYTVPKFFQIILKDVSGTHRFVMLKSIGGKTHAYSFVGIDKRKHFRNSLLSASRNYTFALFFFYSCCVIFIVFDALDRYIPHFYQYPFQLSHILDALSAEFGLLVC